MRRIRRQNWKSEDSQKSSDDYRRIWGRFINRVLDRPNPFEDCLSPNFDISKVELRYLTSPQVGRVLAALRKGDGYYERLSLGRGWGTRCAPAHEGREVFRHEALGELCALASLVAGICRGCPGGAPSHGQPRLRGLPLRVPWSRRCLPVLLGGRR